MFKQGQLFKEIQCPENETCKRPYCSFKHVSKPPPAKIPAVSSGPKKLPSYAPQASPVQPKVTVDYKQIIQKKPLVKPNNLFENLQKPISITNSFNRKRPRPVAPVTSSSGAPKSLFDKFTMPQSKPLVIKVPDEKEGEFSDDEKEVEEKEEEDKNTQSLLPQYSQESESGDLEDLVYKPGVGLTSVKSSNKPPKTSSPFRPKYDKDIEILNVKKPPKKDSKPTASPKKAPPKKLNGHKNILNCSLEDFDDPYSSEVPVATSPSRMDDEDDNESLPKVLDDLDDDVDEEEVLLSDGEEEEEEEIEELKALRAFAEELEEDEIVEVKPPFTKEEEEELPEVPSPVKSPSPVKMEDDKVKDEEEDEVFETPSPVPAWKRKEARKKDEDEIFGPSSPVATWKKSSEASTSESPSGSSKYRRTFQKKRVKEPVKLGAWMQDPGEEEEDEIMTREFQKDLEEQQRKFQRDVGSSSEDESEKKRRKQERLDAIKELKAKIWEKQYKKSIKRGAEGGGSSSSSEHNSASSASSSSDSSGSEIDSNDSVHSVRSSDSLPKRKRKRLSSPMRSDDRPSSSSRHSLDDKSKSSLRKLQKYHTIKIEKKPRKKLKPGAERLMRADSIIPHHIKKKRDSEKKKMRQESNSKTFYGSSKYKREELSHFDPPTPPSEDDPHRFASSYKRNKKRVAHVGATKPKFKTETKPEETKIPIRHPGGPRIDLKERTLIPAANRQVRLDFFITEYLKLWPEDRPKCFAEGVKSEKSCLSKCKTKALYTNLCTNEVKRIREMKSKGTTNQQPKPGSEGSGKSGELTKQQLFYTSILKYKVPKAELKKNFYPGYYEFKPPVLEGNHCTRCSKLFVLTDEGNYVRAERCIHHSGKLRNKNTRGAKGEMDKTRQYDCCGQGDGSPGCAVATGHVHILAYPNRDWKGYFTAKKRDRSPSVWGLDCEMVYTAGGMELARVTVVNHKGETALDMLVNPTERVLDYNTRYSGVTEKGLAGVKAKLFDAQKALYKLITIDCILVGHSLESDLHALQMIHRNVVDTSLVYYGGGYKRGLATLSAECLGRIIQSADAGHDSTEDAVAALDLMKHKLKTTDNVKL